MAKKRFLAEAKPSGTMLTHTVIITPELTSRE
jgi:hypothetical protein